MPRSDTGISGSSTWRSASQIRASTALTPRPSSTGSPSVLSARRSCSSPRALPALQHLVPRHRPDGEIPLALLRVEAGGEGAVDDVDVRLLIEMRRHADAHLLHERHDLAHPVLAQLVVGLALEAVLELY